MVQSDTKIVAILLLVLSITACKDSGTGNEPDPMDTATLKVENQGTSNGNQLVIPSATVAQDGWVVIHRDNGGSPMVPDIIGKAMLKAGSNSDVSIQLGESVTDGEKVWAMVHQDTGVKGEYEFTGSGSPDQPVTVDGKVLTKAFTINQTNPSVSAPDQLNKGGVFVANVDAAEDGWVVIHRSNEAGDGPMVPAIIGKAKVSAGGNGNVFIPLNDGESVAVGEKLWPMLHYDTGTKGEYEFNGADTPDQPVPLDGSVVLTSFTTLQNQSTLTANNQTVVDNSITVDVKADADGWVVVHRDLAGAPNVPPIIAKAQITKGMNTGVKISFGDSVVADGEKVWPMVHYETGVVGEYEFNGAGTPDQPMIIGGSILTQQITLSGATPKVVANNQAAATELTIDEVDANQIGFIVLHRDNTGAPVVPASIGHAQIHTGENDAITITLDDGETVSSGDKIWAMLHIDNGTIGSYDFDGTMGSDDPPVKDSSNNIVMVQFTIQ